MKSETQRRICLKRTYLILWVPALNASIHTQGSLLAVFSSHGAVAQTQCVDKLISRQHQERRQRTGETWLHAFLFLGEAFVAVVVLSFTSDEGSTSKSIISALYAGIEERHSWRSMLRIKGKEIF